MRCTSISEAEAGTSPTFIQEKGAGLWRCWDVGTWETQSLKNAQLSIVRSHPTKVLRLRGL